MKHRELIKRRRAGKTRRQRKAETSAEAMRMARLGAAWRERHGSVETRIAALERRVRKLVERVSRQRLEAHQKLVEDSIKPLLPEGVGFSFDVSDFGCSCKDASTHASVLGALIGSEAAAGSEEITPGRETSEIREGRFGVKTKEFQTNDREPGQALAFVSGAVKTGLSSNGFQRVITDEELFGTLSRLCFAEECAASEMLTAKTQEAVERWERAKAAKNAWLDIACEDSEGEP